MKKLLSIFGGLVIVGSSATSVISCQMGDNDNVHRGFDLSKAQVSIAKIDRAKLIHNEFTLTNLKKSWVASLIKNNKALEGTDPIDYYVNLTREGKEINNDYFWKMPVDDGIGLDVEFKATAAADEHVVTGSTLPVAIAVSETVKTYDLASTCVFSPIKYTAKDDGNPGAGIGNILDVLRQSFYIKNKKFLEMIGIESKNYDFLDVIIYNTQKQPIRSLADIHDGDICSIFFKVKSNKTDIAIIASKQFFGSLTVGAGITFSKPKNKIDVSKIDSTIYSQSNSHVITLNPIKHPKYNDVLESMINTSFNVYSQNGSLGSAIISDWAGQINSDIQKNEFDNDIKKAIDDQSGKDMIIKTNFTVNVSTASKIITGKTPKLDFEIVLHKVPDIPIFDFSANFTDTMGSWLTFTDYLEKKADTEGFVTMTFTQRDLQGDVDRLENYVLSYLANTVLIDPMVNIKGFPKFKDINDYSKYLSVTYWMYHEPYQTGGQLIDPHDFLSNETTETLFSLVISPKKGSELYFKGNMDHDFGLRLGIRIIA